MTSPNKIHSETEPKSDEQQQSHDSKQQISSKELSENSKEKHGTNSILVTDSVTVPKLNHKKQSHDDKQKVTQKNYAKTAKEKVVIAQQMRQHMNNLMSLKGKRKMNITNINKVFEVMLVKKINQ